MLVNKNESQSSGEEVQEEKQEQEVVEADPQEDLKKTLEEEKKARMELESKYKSLSANLTRTQQDYSELLRFQKSVLPKINKTFEEEWGNDPQQAVKNHVESVKNEVVEKTAPITNELAYLKAMNWMSQVVAEDPTKAKYMSKVKEIGSSRLYGHLTFSEEGIRELFDVAEAKENKANIGKQVIVADKKSTYTEGSSPNSKTNSNVNQRYKLTPQEKRVAAQLGLTEEQYAKGHGYLNDAAKNRFED